MLKPRLACTAALLILLTSGCGGGDDDETTTAATPTAAASTAASTSTGGTEDVLDATNAFLALLDDTQKTTVQGERTTGNLAQWSNLPDQLFKRSGLRMDALSTTQQAAVLTILQAALSSDGYAQVTGITTGDGVLKASGGMDLDFGADHYWIRILGTPSETDIWTIQYGGHHLAVNLTLKGDEMTMAPTLWGAQPASYTTSGTTVEPLKGETDAAFAVMDALDDTQQDAAQLDTAITEIVLGAQQDGKTLAEEGVQVSTFTDEQKDLLMTLITEWLSPLTPTQAQSKIEAAEDNLDKTWFAWSGKTTEGEPIYYRVQGPSLVIEFAHQQGQGANAGGVTHIHSIYREPDNDYGAELS
ncbi:hypothetical protein ACTI_70740 [Actinoplanes sp. OR16]|uniref:DUF3500 domain-containing protein n=1 Tax=Actinoplanes sp. OR16 TaxID=946334 RepID=UPI000F6EF24E|nr:DUF3500 domain-containing protein [Actinoplanes sp. OR16]BBH70389.1 hypothetical protein ACTI_70740 [Actinoplanes sp. OR16]